MTSGDSGQHTPLVGVPMHVERTRVEFYLSHITHYSRSELLFCGVRDNDFAPMREWRIFNDQPDVGLNHFQAKNHDVLVTLPEALLWPGGRRSTRQTRGTPCRWSVSLPHRVRRNARPRARNRTSRRESNAGLGATPSIAGSRWNGFEPSTCFLHVAQELGDWPRPTRSTHRELATAGRAPPGTGPPRTPRLSGTLPPAERARQAKMQGLPFPPHRSGSFVSMKSRSDPSDWTAAPPPPAHHRNRFRS